MDQPVFLRFHKDRFVVGNLYFDPAERVWVPWKLNSNYERFLPMWVKFTFQITFNLYGKRAMS